MNIRDVEAIIQSKFGFERATGRSIDHRWYKLHVEGLPVISTKFSHSGGQLSRTIEGKIARQLRVRKGFFVEMVTCSKSQTDYLQQVRNDPFPPWTVNF